MHGLGYRSKRQKAYKTVENGQKHLGTFESERSNALERIVENGHGMVTFTHQKPRDYCIVFLSLIFQNVLKNIF
jgi:hypothetical protein